MIIKYFITFLIITFIDNAFNNINFGGFVTLFTFYICNIIWDLRKKTT